VFGRTPCAPTSGLGVSSPSPQPSPGGRGRITGETPALLYGAPLVATPEEGRRKTCPYKSPRPLGEGQGEGHSCMGFETDSAVHVVRTCGLGVICG